MIQQQNINEMVTELVEVFFNNALPMSIITVLVALLIVFLVAGRKKFRMIGFNVAVIFWFIFGILYTLLFMSSPELREMFDFKILSLWQDEQVTMAAFTIPLLGFTLILVLAILIFMLYTGGPTKWLRYFQNLRPMVQVVILLIIVSIFGILAILILG